MSGLDESLLRDNSRWRFYQSEHELSKSRSKLRAFLLPSLRRLPVHRLLEVGCGSGLFPILLREAGYDAYGVDPDFEAQVTQRYPFLMAGQGQCLPFQDQSFDLSFSLEVIEHVGTTDGMLNLGQSYAAERKLFVRELCRVTSHYVLITTPNKYFPVDEHATNSRGGFSFRVHSPFEHKTLSVSELEAMFRICGFQIASFVNPTGYYQFERVRRTFGRLGVAFANLLLRAAQNRFLGRSPLNPHLFLLFVRSA